MVSIKTLRNNFRKSLSRETYMDGSHNMITLMKANGSFATIAKNYSSEIELILIIYLVKII